MIVSKVFVIAIASILGIFGSVFLRFISTLGGEELRLHLSLLNVLFLSVAPYERVVNRIVMNLILMFYIAFDLLPSSSVSDEHQRFDSLVQLSGKFHAGRINV